MPRRATIPFFLVLFLLAAGTAHAQQEVTIRQLNEIPEANLNQLIANGTTMSIDDIAALMQNDLVDQEVTITAVVLSDPLDSGLGSWDAARGGPNRIHVFVRDVAAATEGPEGMNMQIVDGDYVNTGLLNVVVGDVLRMTGTVSFSQPQAVQFSPTTIEPLGSLQDNNLPESILDPLVRTTGDLNENVGEGLVHVRWENYADLVNQEICLEGATVLRRTLADAGRPGWIVSSDAGTTYMQNDDVSLRYRNDRAGVYAAPFHVRDANDPFQPPPVGSAVNVCGFATMRGTFEPFDLASMPAGAAFKIVPFTDDDLEVTQLPNVRTITVAPLDAVPGDAPVPVSVAVDADPGAVASVTLVYVTSTGIIDAVLLTDQGDGTWAGEIPAQADGAFVTYSVVVINTDGIEFEPGQNTFRYRVLFDGINEVEDIQRTVEDGEGPSPFAGLTTEMDLTVTVQSHPGVSGIVAVQDDDTGAPWSGIILASAAELEGLERGDVINITSAQIEESFDLTRLRDVTFTVVSEGGDGIPYKVVTTDVLQDEAVAEAHEGMALRFENPVITSTNPDAPGGPFGEWAFSSDGTATNQVRADDQSNAITFPNNDAAASFSVWERLEFIQGIWSFTFSNYKLWPEDPDADVGAVTNVATEEEGVPGGFALRQNYPNPFNPATTIRYEIGSPVRVTLAVFDVLGRRVATLVDAQQATGVYDVAFEAGHLPSGLYVYRLEAGTHVETRHMMLLK